jgi:hypothetical protein
MPGTDAAQAASTDARVNVFSLEQSVEKMSHGVVVTPNLALLLREVRNPYGQQYFAGNRDSSLRSE